VIVICVCVTIRCTHILATTEQKQEAKENGFKADWSDDELGYCSTVQLPMLQVC
jgi:hypothetical protein